MRGVMYPTIWCNLKKMKNITLIILCWLFLLFSNLKAQTIRLDSETLDSNKVSIAFERNSGKKSVRVVKDSTIKEVDEPTFAKIKNIDFKNGIIKVKVLSRLLKNAPETARGFIGIAFRINEDNSAFECIYIRPTNGRAEEQIRRNHAIQYFSFPDFKFPRLRKESPEKYESYADMGLNEWIKLKIVVNGKQAKLFLNNNKQPSLIVNDLKHGENASGAIGLFADVGTEGYFSNLKIVKQ
jgi:hypothetical protein